MGSSYQIREGGLPHFLTFQVVDWVDLFSRELYRELFVSAVHHAVLNRQLSVYAWCIMTNHVHLILGAPDGTLSGIVRDLKGFTSRQFIKAIQSGPESRSGWLVRHFESVAALNMRVRFYQVWTHHNHAVVLETNDMLESRIQYIHNNPVRAGWVDVPEAYCYSSARDYSGEVGLLPIALP